MFYFNIYVWNDSNLYLQSSTLNESSISGREFSLDPAGWHDGPPGAAVLPQAAAALVLPQGPAVPDHQAAAPGTGHAASGHVDNVPQILLVDKVTCSPCQTHYARMCLFVSLLSSPDVDSPRLC